MSVFATLYFNYHYLPWSQAKKLPIYLHKPRFYREWGGQNLLLGGLHGEVLIESSNIYTGMIRLGFIQGTSHADVGFIWANYGKVIFGGRCLLAQNCSIRNGGGILRFGENFSAGANTKFICYKSINIGAYTSSSWDVTYCDFDFHSMKDVISDKKRTPYGEIKIGAHNWICQNVIVLKNTTTPNYITIAAGTIVSKKFQCEEKSIICGSPAKVIQEGKRYMEITDCEYKMEN